jgi:hypothetical protein
MIVYFTIYALVAVVCLLVLTLVAQVTGFFFRAIAGTTTGAFTSWYLQGLTPALSYLEACAGGDLGMGGFAVLISLNILAMVWGWNLWRTGDSFVR